MQFYELRNHVKNKAHNLYDDAKVAALNEMTERGYITSVEVRDDVMCLIVDHWDGLYEEAMNVGEFLEEFRKLDAEKFDGEVVVTESGDFGRTYPISRPKVDKEDYTFVFYPVE